MSNRNRKRVIKTTRWLQRTQKQYTTVTTIAYTRFLFQEVFYKLSLLIQFFVGLSVPPFPYFVKGTIYNQTILYSIPMTNHSVEHKKPSAGAKAPFC